MNPVSEKDILNLEQWMRTRNHIREEVRKEMNAKNPEYVVRGVYHAVITKVLQYYENKKTLLIFPDKHPLENPRFKRWVGLLQNWRRAEGGSLEDFMCAVSSSEYPGVPDWGYGTEGNPYTPAIDLWNAGFVAFEGSAYDYLCNAEDGTVAFKKEHKI